MSLESNHAWWLAIKAEKISNPAAYIKDGHIYLDHFTSALDEWFDIMLSREAGKKKMAEIVSKKAVETPVEKGIKKSLKAAIKKAPARRVKRKR